MMTPRAVAPPPAGEGGGIFRFTTYLVSPIDRHTLLVTLDAMLTTT